MGYCWICPSPARLERGCVKSTFTCPPRQFSFLAVYSTTVPKLLAPLVSRRSRARTLQVGGTSCFDHPALFVSGSSPTRTRCLADDCRAMGVGFPFRPRAASSPSLRLAYQTRTLLHTAPRQAEAKAGKLPSMIRYPYQPLTCNN